VLIYTEKITPRLQYITDFIGREMGGQPFPLTTDRFYFSDFSGPKINYSHERIHPDDFFIIPYTLLFEEGIREQAISCIDVNGEKAFFKTGGDYPFDIFAASFYLLSRYEEYLPHRLDEYGRYAHENSLAYREGFLQRPLVNNWIQDFEKTVKIKFPAFSFQHPSFSFLPTYDIDEAFAYRHKGIVRALGGMVKSAIGGQWEILKERLQVMRQQSGDPYDAYKWMDQLHEKNNLQPIYFFQVAAQRGKYDKNILPSQPAMKQLIRQHAEKYSMGIHPSWKSGDEESLLQDEIKTLESAGGRKITASRQHYIRFKLPHTFRRLIAAGISDDYSMGYGSINGFRASVAVPFYWYDLKYEKSTSLLLHPFCFMEANSCFEQQYLPQRAYEEMMHYYHAVKSVNGTLITIWHNNFLGTYPLFRGWREVYNDFVSGISR
jgi:hypothetical protein